MTVRRLMLLAALAVWGGMLATLGYRRHAQGLESAGPYIRALFSPDVAVLETKAVWLRENLTGTEKRLGFFETQLTQIGSNDVHVRHTLNIYSKDVPPMVAALIRQMASQFAGEGFELRDFEGQLDVYVNRFRGLVSVKGRGRFGEDKLEFWGRPAGGRHLRVVTRWGRQDRADLLPYDPRMPFGTGGSPFLGMKNLREGMAWTVNFFDPLTRTSVARRIQVNRRENLRHRGKDVPCMVLTAHPVAGTSGAGDAGGYGPPVGTAWVSVDQGQVLKEEAQMLIFTLSMVLEDSVTAAERDYRKTLPSPLEGDGGGQEPAPKGGTGQPEGQGGSDRGN